MGLDEVKRKAYYYLQVEMYSESVMTDDLVYVWIPVSECEWTFILIRQRLPFTFS